MHVTIKVTDLSLQEWDYLQDKLMTSYSFLDNEVRVCAEFELTPDLNVRHAEMPIRMFAGIVTRLERHRRMAMAALTPDALPDTESGQDQIPADRVTAAQFEEFGWGGSFQRLETLDVFPEPDEGNASIPASYDREPDLGRY